MQSNLGTFITSTIRQLLLLLLERIARLEAVEEERARETRPLWQRLDGQVTTLLADMHDVKENMKLARREIGLLREDIRNERMERAALAERVTDLEQDRQMA
ncbi:MAG: hypothetical protein ACREEM_24560 [Blastocatellia bacterium]